MQDARIGWGRRKKERQEKEKEGAERKDEGRRRDEAARRQKSHKQKYEMRCGRGKGERGVRRLI